MSALGEGQVSQTGGPVRRVPRLPACRSCHQRKVKCDNKRPKCAPCTRNGTACILIFPGSEHETVSREELHELEQKEQALTTGARQTAVAEEEGSRERSPVWHYPPPASTAVHAISTTAPAGKTDTASGSGSGSGLTEWRKSQAHLMQTLGRTAKAAEAAEAHVEASAMPSAKDVHYLFEKYLMGSHVQNPFLLRHEVEQLYVRVFSASESGDAVGQATSQDIFRTFMILAIATVVPYRLGEHPHHPLGYYLAAMPHFGSDFLATKLESVQDLLLICRFGIFYHIGTSIWDTIQLCGRLCIELGLHRPRERPATDMLQEQIERRVFWEYYMLDRYSSTTISRPFALADRDITVPFCADADDEEIRQAGAAQHHGHRLDLDTFCRTRTASGPTEMSVFLLCVRLRQISSRIQTEFSQLVSGSSAAMGSGPTAPPAFLLTGRIYALLDDILRAIDEWRRGAPVFAAPRVLYEMSEWYDLLLARERLHAVRKAMDLAPKHDDGGSGGGLPARHLLALCLDAATNTIRLYGGLFHSHVVTYTRSYFHTVFTAGLSVMFCCCASSPAQRQRQNRDRDPDRDRADDYDHSRERIRQARSVLVLCEKTLAHMGAQLPDARGYVTAFEALHKSVSLRLDQALQADDEDDIDDVDDSQYPLDHSRPGNSYQTDRPRRRLSPGRSAHVQDPALWDVAAAASNASNASNANVGTLAALSPSTSSVMAAAASMNAQFGQPQQHFALQQQQHSLLQHQHQHSHQHQQHPHHPHQQHQHLSPASVTMGNLVLGPEADSFYGRPGLSGPGPFAPSDMTTSHSGFGHAAAPGLSSYGSLPAAPVRNDLLQWAFLSDDTMWNVVGEYVYGDPNETLELFNGFDFGLS